MLTIMNTETILSYIMQCDKYCFNGKHNTIHKYNKINTLYTLNLQNCNISKFFKVA